MSPRPQTLSDADLLDGARRAIDRVGVMRLTLGDVAAELRISPGTLVHRFGSKRGLLLDLLRRSVSRSAERFAALRAARGSAYATLLGLADHMARHIPNAEVLAITSRSSRRTWAMASSAGWHTPSRGPCERES